MLFKRIKQSAQNNEGKNKGEQDNRLNTYNIQGDRVIDEIGYYLAQYRGREMKFERARLIYEKVALITLFITLLLACLVYSPFLFGEDILGKWDCRFETSVAMAITLSIFIINYFYSRLKGHTRGWSRNRLMRERLEILEREYRLAVYQKDEIQDARFLESEQENTLAKLFELETENRITTQKDIVGDYLAANEGTFNWINGIRK